MKPYHFQPLREHRGNEWYSEILRYLHRRYPPIVNRINNSIRYVDIDPANYATFSYEYASLLRDIGGSFSSVMDSFLKGLDIEPKYAKNHVVGDYRDFLFDTIEDLDRVCVKLFTVTEKRTIFPFEDFIGNEFVQAEWWKAYNAIKHTEIHSLLSGCLSNVLYSFSALSILFDSLTRSTALHPRTVSEETGNLISHIFMVEREVFFQVFPKMGAQSARDGVRVNAHKMITDE